MSLQSLFALAAQHAIAYRDAVGEAAPPRSYAAMRETFDAPTPEQGRAVSEVIEELVALSTPGLRAMTGSRFFGWVIGASHPAGVAADWLTSAWGQNAGNHEASPAAAAAETAAAKWLLDLLDLPREASVGFVTGATVANFVCLAAARGAVLRRAGWDVEANGLFGAPPIPVLIGDDAHTSVFSALQFLGLGHDRVVRVATDAQGRMLPAAFAHAIAGTNGPAIVITQAGQLNTGAFDPIEAILPAARERGAWVHVDGAFGLWARASAATAHLASGYELADSWATDGHKWLQTPYDCGYAIVRDAEAHRRAMTIAASYLPPVADGDRDPTHFVPELSRRARGFATWAMIRHLGRAGIAALVQEHCRLATRFADRLVREPGVYVLNDVGLNQVIVRFGKPEADQTADRLTQETILRLQADGTCFAGGARWRDRWVMRLSVISAPTTEQDIDTSCQAICAAWRSVAGGNVTAGTL
ncbi:MAG TPA: aspartate aminotransferase family protein [Steroidobacteraceae bacterium]|nr:aspartate aminotransferase family protein [Steroidobacteraceae bacterium]